MTPHSPTPGEPFATTYVLALLPETDINFRAWQLRVVWVGHGWWAVQYGGFQQFLNHDGAWERPPYNPDSDPHFFDRTQFRFDEACRRAKEALQTMTVGDMTAAEALRRRELEDAHHRETKAKM